MYLFDAQRKLASSKIEDVFDGGEGLGRDTRYDDMTYFEYIHIFTIKKKNYNIHAGYFINLAYKFRILKNVSNDYGISGGSSCEW